MYKIIYDRSILGEKCKGLQRGKDYRRQIPAPTQMFIIWTEERCKSSSLTLVIIDRIKNWKIAELMLFDALHVYPSI